jgi:hypothetical protein
MIQDNLVNALIGLRIGRMGYQGSIPFHSVCVSVYPSSMSFWTPEPIFTKLGTYITAPELISTAHYINPSHQSVRLYVYPLIVTRQWIDKNAAAATNTYATIELLDASFSVRSVLYQREVGDLFFPELVLCWIFSVLAVDRGTVG